MTAKYIPQADGMMAHWAQNFSSLIDASPTAYGLMPSDAAVISAAVGMFADAYAVATTPGTRTMPKVAQKDGTKAAMLHTLRWYAQTIKKNRGISNEAKIGLGLHIDSTSPRPMGAPISAPELQVQTGGFLQHVLRFHDSSAPTTRAKPFGVKGLLVFRSVGSAPPEDRELMPFYGMATRQPFLMGFDLPDLGKTAYYFGRWVTAAGLVGPWSVLMQRVVA